MANPMESESRYRAVVERIPLVTYTAAPDEVRQHPLCESPDRATPRVLPEDFLADPELFASRSIPTDRERVALERSTAAMLAASPFAPSIGC